MEGLKRPRTQRTRAFGFDEKVQLIKQVHSRPVLWDIRDKRHFDGVYLKRAWESVAAAMNKDFNSCKTAWKSLRDSHRYYIKTSKKKGVHWDSGGWRLASHLSFLPKEVRERGRSNTSTFNPVEREDSESAQDVDDECEETASHMETDISSLIEDAKDLDKDLSNWTEDLYSSIGKVREKREELSPVREKEQLQQQMTTLSRPIFAYWESLLNKMSPEDADAAEQQMTQALWAEMAATKYKNVRVHHCYLVTLFHPTFQPTYLASADAKKTEMLRQNLLDQLKHFIETVSKGHSNPQLLTNPSLIKLALGFLEELPATRDIVFEYFALLAEISVQLYVSPDMADPKTGMPVSQVKQAGNRQQQARAPEYESFNIVKTALQSLVWKGPPAWAPLIANWSLELVAKLSDKYTQRRMTITASCNYWLECSAMHGLMTLINSCFRKLTQPEEEACVEIMLNAFHRFPMTFDWIVARLGGCFPYKIIMQILQCGIKRFVEDYRCHLDSEAGILDYMTSCHEQHLRAAFREMLRDGFAPKKQLDVAVVPFLLITTNYSDAILQSLVNVLVEIYSEDMSEVIVQKSPLWLSNKMFADMQPTLNNAVLRLNEHGATLLIIAARMAEKYAWCQDFLDNSMQELEQWVLNQRNFPLLADLAYEETKYQLWKSCLSTNLFEQQTAVRLLLVVSSQHPHIYYQTISQLLRKSYAQNPNGIGALIRLLGGQSGMVNFPGFTPGFKMVLEDITLHVQVDSRLPVPPGTPTEAFNTFSNLNILAKMHKSKNVAPYIKAQQLNQALNECLPKIVQIFDCTVNKLVLKMDRDAAEHSAQKFKAQQSNNNNNNNNDLCNGYGKRAKLESGEGKVEDEDATRMRLAHLIVDLLNNIEAGSRANVLRSQMVLKLAVLSVKYFFVGLTERTVIRRAAASHRSYNLLQRQCSARKIARTMCLRELVEGALFYHGHLLGQLEEYELDELQIPEHELLILQNLHTSSGANSNRSVLHSGIIGRGLRPVLPTNERSCDAEKQALYLKALNACCADLEKPNNVEGYSLVSLLLVELVSTDVMYNGLPFPDEEFTKVTMERDMQIRRAFITSPVLWAVLGLIAAHRPALCYSSVLLRALCATCLHHWRGKNVNKYQPTSANDELMLCTKKMLQLLAMSQLIPPPLTNLHLIIDHFESAEIALLLRECIWNYLKDHVPSPALFHVDNNGLHWRNTNTPLARVPPQYVDTLRHLMQRKLSTLGHHYHQMFIMGELMAGQSSEPDPTARLEIVELD